jgi:multiple sugar transport system substrate-binding protein
MTRDDYPPPIARRRLFRLTLLGAGATAATGLLAACGGAPAAAPTAAPTAAPAKTDAKPAAEPTKPGAADAKPAATTAPAAAKPAASGPVNLIWDTFRGVGTPWPDEMISTFKAKNPKVTIELRPIPIPNSQQEAYPKMYAMFAANTLGDVFAFDPSHWEFYRAVKQGILRPLDEYVASDKFDLTQFFDPFVKMQHWEGKLWGLPSWGWSGHDGIIYNEIAAQEAGVALPDHTKPDWSMDQIYRDAVKLHKAGAGGRAERFGANLSLAAIGATVTSRAFNGDILSEDGKKATLTDPNATKALRWIYDLCQKEKVVALPGGFEGNANDLFASGKLGMIMAGSLTVFQIGNAIKDPSKAKMKAVLFPKRSDGKRPSQMRGGTWNVGSKSQNAQWGWEFIKHITNKEGMLLFNTKGNNGALTRPDILEDKYFTGNPNFMVYKENLLTAIPAIVPANYRGTEYEDTFAQAHSEVYLGKIDFDAGVKKMQETVQRVLDKPIT